MGLNEFFQMLLNFISEEFSLIALVGFLATTFIEISKIKLNPWSALARLVGRAINKEVFDKLDKMDDESKGLKKDIDNIALQMDLDKIEAIHDEIFAFASSCKNHERHTVKQFLRIFEKYQEYEALIAKRGLKNGVMEIEIAYIERVYNKCLDNNAFLELVDEIDEISDDD